MGMYRVSQQVPDERKSQLHTKLESRIFYSKKSSKRGS